MTTRGLYHDRPRPPRPEGCGPTAQEIGRAALERIFAMLADSAPERMTRSQRLGVMTRRFDPAERFTCYRDVPPTWRAFWDTAGGEHVRTEPQATREHALECAEIMLEAGFAPPSSAFAAHVQGRSWVDVIRECGGRSWTGWKTAPASRQSAVPSIASKPSNEVPR
jgi:hypothetical protein